MNTIPTTDMIDMTDTYAACDIPAPGVIRDVPSSRKRSTQRKEPVIDPLTGKVVLQCFIKAHHFIRAGRENREWVAYQAYKGRVPWPYGGMPLNTVIGYLKWRGMP